MANYNGTIELIAGLTPANNNKEFPLVDAPDVNVEVPGINAVRLDAALEELLNNGVKDEDVKKILLDMGIENNIDTLIAQTTDLNDRVFNLENPDQKTYVVQYDLNDQTLYLNEVTLVKEPKQEDLGNYFIYDAESGTYIEASSIEEGQSYYTVEIISSTKIPYDSSKNTYTIQCAVVGADRYTTLLGRDANISYSFAVKDSDGGTVVSKGEAQYYVNGTYVFSKKIDSGSIVKDEISKYLREGANAVNVVLSWSDTVGDETEVAKTRTLRWNISQVNMYLTSTFDASKVQFGGSFTFYYTPFGNGLAKAVILKLDGEKVYEDNVGTISNITRSYDFKNLSHGIHQIEAYVTTAIDGAIVPSESLFFDVIVVQDGVKTPIIRISHDYQPVMQYDTKEIEYSVYDPTLGFSTSFSIEIKIDGETALINKEAINGTVYNWTYRPGNEITFNQEAGIYLEDEKEIIITVKYKDFSENLKVIVERFPYDINQIEAGLELDFNPISGSNDDIVPNGGKIYKNITWNYSSNFDWISGGYQTVDNEKCFVIKAGSSITFNYALFGNNPTESGREFKIIYKISNVKKIDSSWLTCMNDTGTIGLNMRPHETYILHDGGTLYHPLSEEDIIEFDMNLFKLNSDIPMIMTYEDGCPSYPLIYSNVNSLEHNNMITIGSPECDIYIYRVKAYSTNLTDNDILTNFEADARSSEEMIRRFSRNQIFDYEADSSLYADNLTPEKVSEMCPDLRVIAIETPYFTNGKKYFYGNTHVRQYYANGNRFDSNWEAWNCIHAGQGTSSDGYGPSGRNIDIYMCIDGVDNGGVKSSDGLKLKGQDGIDLAGGKTILKYLDLAEKNEKQYFEVTITNVEDILNYYLKVGDEFIKITEDNKEEYLVMEETSESVKDGIYYVFRDEEYKRVISPVLENILNYYVKNGESYIQITEENKNNYIEPKGQKQAVKSGKYYVYSDTITDGTGKIALTDSSVPNNIFNIKVNIASSENANNALLQKRFDRYLDEVYTTQAKARDPRVKGSMEFFNCVVFLREIDDKVSDGVYVNHREFNDTKWHFYAIGNIGDSKKTDTTRASDPKDKDEFTIEITDWNHPLSNFPMGDKWFVINTANKEDEEVEDTYSLRYLTNKNLEKGYIFRRTGEEGSYQYVKLTRENIDLDVGKGIVSIEKDGGKVTTKVTEEFYTQAKFIPFMEDYDDEWNYDARYKGKNKSYKYVWPAFYNFVTRPLLSEGDKSSWKQELKEWFAGSDNGVGGDAVFYWYLFTLRYTMVDNRGKNTFWHWGKTNGYHLVSNPIKEMLHFYSEKNGDKYTLTEDTEIQPKNYYCNYAFDFWDYDNDTALGINNIGVLAMDYGVEDGINLEDDFNNGEAHFRCHDSTLFTRVRDLCSSELAILYKKINQNTDCWTAASLISEFDEWQNQFPEALWHLDYLRKYKRPYLNGSSLPQNTYEADQEYLTGKMNGKKKYQRRQFERNQWFYMSSKFDTAPFSSSVIYLRGSGVEKDVKPDVSNKINITAYSKMYIKATRNQVEGQEAEYSKRRLSPGETAEIVYPDYKDGRLEILYIFGANNIASLGDLSKLYLQELHLGTASKLQELILGNSNANYSNNFLPSIQFGANGLLEYINIQNINSLSGTLDISNLSRLKELNARGTKLSMASFANGGMLEKAYLPETITFIKLKNLNYLEEQNIIIENNNYSNIKDINIQYCPVFDSATFMKKVNLNNIERLTLLGIDWEDKNIQDATLFNRFLSLKGFNSNDDLIPQSLISGSVYIDSIRQSELASFNETWPELKITYNEQNYTPEIPVHYYNDNVLIKTVYIGKNNVLSEPVRAGLFNAPTKLSDEKNDYTFNGTWLKENGQTFAFNSERVPEELSLYAGYNIVPRKYNVEWRTGYGENALLYQLSDNDKKVLYGESVSYPFELGFPKRPYNQTSTICYVFKGWDTDTNFIKGDTVVKALWEAIDPTNIIKKPLNECSPSELLAVADFCRYDSYTPPLPEYISQESSAIWKSGESYIDVQLGYMPECNEENGDKILISDKTIFDINESGYYPTSTNLHLFEDNMEDWTLALDFEFKNSDINSTLISCFKDDIGFKIIIPPETSTYKNNLTLTWGTSEIPFAFSTKPTSAKSNREILVLKYIKNSNKIYIYYNNRYTTELIKEAYLETTYAPHSNEATLSFGGNIHNLQNNVSLGKNANGVIYNARFWNKALPSEECKKICSWVYTKERFYIELPLNGFYNGLADGTNITSQALFVAEKLLDRSFSYPTSPKGGYKVTALNNWLNNKFIMAFPDEWRKIIPKVKFPSGDGLVVNQEDKDRVEAGESLTINTTSITSDNIYVRIPTLIELGIDSNYPYSEEGSKKPFDGIKGPSNRIKQMYNGTTDKNDNYPYWLSSVNPSGQIQKTTGNIITINDYTSPNLITATGTRQTYSYGIDSAGILPVFYI